MLNSNLTNITQTIISSNDTKYFSVDGSFAFGVSNNSFYIIKLRVEILQTIGNSITAPVFKDMPFTFAYDFIIPMSSAKGDVICVKGVASTNKINLIGGVELTAGNIFYGNAIVPKQFIQ